MGFEVELEEGEDVWRNGGLRLRMDLWGLGGMVSWWVVLCEVGLWVGGALFYVEFN